MLDASGLPTAECPNCASALFKTAMSFDPDTYKVAMYFLEGECVNCGTLVTLPTPLDKEAWCD
jgi:hypothetical protein